RDRVKTGHRVLRVTRHNLGRAELAGHPVRADLPFRLLVATPGGEQFFEADAVLDASGTYGQPAPLVAANSSAPYVRERLIRNLGSLHERIPELAGRRMLLAGHGHSAANALLQLAGLAREAPETRVVWAIRSRNLRPFPQTPGDPLPERARVV